MSRELFSLPTAATATMRERSGRPVLRGVICAGAIAALAIGLAGTASAQPPETSEGQTTANVEVGSLITLGGLTGSFTLTGLPGATVTQVGAVHFNVQTTNPAGYSVTVRSLATQMSAPAGNSDTIPIGALSVRKSGTTTYTALTGGTQAVQSQATRSAVNGDDLSNDYQVIIPFVNADTYSATLDYVATAT